MQKVIDSRRIPDLELSSQSTLEDGYSVFHQPIDLFLRNIRSKRCVLESTVLIIRAISIFVEPSLSSSIRMCGIEVDCQALGYFPWSEASLYTFVAKERSKSMVTV